MKLRHGLACSLLVTVILGLTISATEASSIPNWVKGVAGWYSQDKISEKEYLDGIEYLINSGAIKPKIIQDQEAKIKQLEAQLADYQKQPKAVQTYPELRQSTSIWMDGQISDAVYIKQVQGLIDNGVIGPFDSDQSPLDSNARQKQINAFKELAGSWLQDGMQDEYFVGEIEALYQAGIVNNPKSYAAPVMQKADSVVDETQTLQKSIDQSQAKMFDNAKQWTYGYISTETYLENIISMNRDGVFDPFMTYAQQTRGDYDKIFTEKAVPGILKNDMLMDALRADTKRFVDDQTPTSYLNYIGSTFATALN